MSTVVLVIDVLYKEHVMEPCEGSRILLSVFPWNARVKRVSDDLNLFASITNINCYSRLHSLLAFSSFYLFLQNIIAVFHVNTKSSFHGSDSKKRLQHFHYNQLR